MKKYLTVAATHLGAIAVGVMLLWMFGGSIGNWRRQQKLETAPQVLEQTKEAAKAERHSLTPEEAQALCGGLQVMPDRAGNNAKAKGDKAPVPDKHSFSLGVVTGDVVRLDQVRIDRLEHGGVADVTLTAGADRPVVTVYPNPRPWIEGMSRWRLSALVGAPIDGSGSGVMVVPSVSWRGLRTGRIDFGAGVSYCPAKSVIAGGVVGFE